MLNFGPDALGNFPPEQAGVLNEMALWMFINREAFEQTVPHNTIREDNLWFLTSKDKRTAYIFIDEDGWKLGDRKVYNIKSIRSTDQSQISILGHNGIVLEYQPDVNPAPVLHQTEQGLEIQVTRAQRMYNDRRWNNPIVVRISDIAGSE